MFTILNRDGRTRTRKQFSADDSNEFFKRRARAAETAVDLMLTVGREIRSWQPPRTWRAEGPSSGAAAAADEKPLKNDFAAATGDGGTPGNQKKKPVLGWARGDRSPTATGRFENVVDYIKETRS